MKRKPGMFGAGRIRGGGAVGTNCSSVQYHSFKLSGVAYRMASKLPPSERKVAKKSRIACAGQWSAQREIPFCVVQEARKLYEQGKKSVREVAYIVGYPPLTVRQWVNYVTRVFS